MNVHMTQTTLVRAPQRKPLDPRHLWHWTTLAPLFAVLVVFVLTVLDPLGFDAVTKSQSAKILYKIYSAGYPHKTHNDVTVMRDNIVLVFLDNFTLEEKFKETWPPSQRLHSTILNAILDHNPAAVLVDLVFLHAESSAKIENINAKITSKNCNTDMFTNDFRNTAAVASEYNERHIPLFVVAASKGIGANPPGRPELNELAFCNKVTLVSAELEGEPGQPPLYPLHVDSTGYEPAALALYHAICPTDGSRPSNNSLSRIQRDAGSKCIQFSDHKSIASMEVVWGLAPSEINCSRAGTKALKLACEDLSKSMLSRAAQLLWQVPTPEEHRLTDPFPIPYHAEIPTSELLNGDNNDELNAWLNGKIVIYSSQVTPKKDFVLSPVHGNVDGAFIHAMALDNLLTFGDKYVYRFNEGRFNGHWTMFLPTFIMLLASLAVIGYRYYLLSAISRYNTVESLREADENFVRWAVRWPAIGIILIFGMVLFFFVGIAPFNWLGLLVVVHVWHRIDKWFFYTVKREAHVAGWT
jgi:hypothetical protein